jgi:hypothetical protein
MGVIFDTGKDCITSALLFTFPGGEGCLFFNDGESSPVKKRYIDEYFEDDLNRGLRVLNF